MTLTNTAAITAAVLDAWIDFDGDGAFNDPRDRIATNLALVSGANSIPVNVPCDSAGLTTYGRFRLGSVTSPTPHGPAADGEVEDYAFVVEQPSIGVAKALVSVDRLDATLYRVIFDVVVENTGNVALANVQVVEDLATTFADAASFSVTSVVSAQFTVDPAFDGGALQNLLAPGNTLAIGGSGSIRLTLEVDSGGHQGPYENSVTASGVSPGGDPVEDVSQDGADPDPDDDGDPGDNGDPTPFTLVLSVIEIPTLGEFGLGALAVLLAAAARRRIRRR